MSSCVDKPGACPTVWTRDGERADAADLVAQVVEDEVQNEDENATGLPTPAVAALPRPLLDLRDMLATLWDDGEEHTIYMMEGFVRVELQAPERGPGTVEWGVWQELRRYGSAGDTGYLTPWWKLWIKGIVDRWRLLLPEGRSPSDDEASLMQNEKALGTRRLEEWRVFMQQVRDLPEGVRRMIVFLMESGSKAR